MAENVEISADLSFDSDTAKNILQALHQELDKPTPDRTSGALADQVVREYILALAENSSVVTGTGLESIESQHIGPGTYGVYLAEYLDQVDQGRNSGNHPPVRNNERMQQAAEAYNMSPYALAEHIAKYGTRAHPFKEKALERLESKSRDIAESELEELRDKIQDAI